MKGAKMCERCEEIDAKIARYLRLTRAVNDKRTAYRFVVAISELESEKMALHPKQGD